ncbi:MAG: zinc-ribbon domain-containing protein [Planctomycetota bacterium]|nr:MAG: zinc-ribbon domain-containing protein [Planctomycetota bacterium]
MAIKLKCKCGQILKVPDQMAGKAGKCPKCKQVIKIPTPKPQAAAKGSGAKTSTAPAADPGLSGLDALFEEVGLVQKTGPTCPDCGNEVKPGAILCTNCGYNLQTGEKLSTQLRHRKKKKDEEPEEKFDNLYLQEAAENMKRDMEMDARRERAAMPWWVLMSFLIGALTLAIGGVIIVDGKFGEPAPESTFIGKVQRWPVSTTLGLTALITGMAISLFAQMDLTAFGFRRSVKEGLLCMFLPLIYSLYYGLKHWHQNKAPIKAFAMALIFAGIGIGLILQGGGFGIIINAFR